MRKFLRHCWLLLFGALMTLTTQEARASHAIGSDMNYVNVGPNMYFVTYRFYRDCSGISGDPSYTLEYSGLRCGPQGTGTNAGGSIQLPKRSISDGNPYCDRVLATQQPCDSTGGVTTPFPNYQVWSYSGIVTLPAQCSEWKLSVSVSARPLIGNLENEGNLFSLVRLNNRDVPDDSSPAFSVAPGFKPLIFVCDSSTNSIGNAVTDPDGDSLVFSLASALNADNSPDTYANGYTPQSPLRRLTSPNDSVFGLPIVPFQIDRNNGTISFTAGANSTNPANENEQNKFVVVVQIDAYRRVGGQVIRTGSVRRDILVVIYPCVGLPNSPIVPNGDSVITNPGVDTTLYNSQYDTIDVDACNSSRIEFPILDINGDSIFALIDTSQLPGGASLQIIRQQATGVVRIATARLIWVPSDSTVGGQYPLTISIRDNGCPVPTQSTLNLLLRVTRNNYADVGLNTRNNNGAEDTLCAGESTKLIATTQRTARIGNRAARYTYTWLQDPDSSIIRTNKDTAVVAPLRTTRYQLEIQSELGCIDTASIVVNVAPLADTLPVIPTVKYLWGTQLVYGQNYSADPSFVSTAVPNLRAGNDPDGTIYKYRIRGKDVGLYFSDTTSTTPTVSGLRETTTFQLAQISATSCITYRSFTIEVPLQIPNIITPNNDGKNDEFIIAGLGDAEVSFFNRWGIKVKELKTYSPSNAWKAEDVPAGTYYYLIKDKATNKEYKGWLQVVK